MYSVALYSAFLPFCVVERFVIVIMPTANLPLSWLEREWQCSPMAPDMLVPCTASASQMMPLPAPLSINSWAASPPFQKGLQKEKPFHQPSLRGS